MSDFDAQVDRINKLTSNARNTWFVLLGVLVFVTITLMGVEDIDFYGVDRATKLPLVDVEVPTRLFFVAAPILAAAVYGYFHLYLIRLWDALGAALDLEENGRKLADLASPWLVTELALHLRDGASSAKAMDLPARWLNVLLAWLFGLGVLVWLWWESATARSLVLTGICALALFVSAAVAYASYRAMYHVLRDGGRAGRAVTGEYPLFLHYSAGGPLLLILSLARVALPLDWLPLAPVQLAEARLVERPDGWLQWEHAKWVFKVGWCEREGLGKKCEGFEARRGDFEDEWRARRRDEVKGLRSPDLHSWTNAEFLRRLRKAQPKDVSEVATFTEKNSRSGSQLQYAELSGSFLAGINLILARLHHAQLFYANLEGADLSGAQLHHANMFEAQLQGASLRRAQLIDTHLVQAQLQGADFTFARVHNSELRGADLQNAVFRGAELRFVDFNLADLNGADFRMSTNQGSALRALELSGVVFDTQTDWRNVFLDASVTFGPEFQPIAAHSQTRPCQWSKKVAESDQDFYALWRWWVSLAPYSVDWKEISPPGHEQSPVATNTLLKKYGIPEDCAWKTGPLKTFPGPHGP